MTWQRDEAKLERVRGLMADEELDALVVRAPDNVLYLTNFWGMKGYDACVFPRDGDPVLICLEASEEDASRSAWTSEVRYIRGYADDDPRPPFARTLDAAVDVARPYGRVGLELSLGTQASDRMVGEPTTFTKAWFDAFPDAADATPLLARARSLKTEQEVARVRIANEIAAQAMHAVRRRLDRRVERARERRARVGRVVATDEAKVLRPRGARRVLLRGLQAAQHGLALAREDAGVVALHPPEVRQVEDVVGRADDERVEPLVRHQRTHALELRVVARPGHRSASTIIRISSRNRTVGSQPSVSCAFDASPINRSTSAGRTYRGSSTTWSCQSRPA